MAYNSPYQPASLARLVQTVAKRMKPLLAASRALSAPPVPEWPQLSTYLSAAQLIQQETHMENQFSAAQALLKNTKNSLCILSEPSLGKSALISRLTFEKYAAVSDATQRFYEQEKLFSRSFRLQTLDISFAAEAAQAAVRELEERRNHAIHSIDQLIEGFNTAEFSTLDCINLGLVESLENYHDLESLDDEHNEVVLIIRLLERLKENVNETWAGIVRLRRVLKNKSSLIDCSCTALSRFARRTRAMLLTYQIKPTHLPNGRLLSVFDHLRGYLTQLHSPVTSTFSRCYFPSPSFSQNVAVSGLIIQWLRKLRRNDSI